MAMNNKTFNKLLS